MKILNSKFPSAPLWIKEKLKTSTNEGLEIILDRLLQAVNLEEILEPETEQ